MKGLFINNSEKKDSIHISGVMVYECLKSSKKFSIDYLEVDINNRQISAEYDFYLFNYHPATMHWLDTRSLRKYLKNVGTVILEVLPNDPFVLCPARHFDYYCVLDPTIKSKKNIYSFPRPLDKFEGELPVVHNQTPVVGTFGFATKGKGFQHVVDAVNKEFDKAVIRINIPYGDFVPDSKEYAAFLADVCKKRAKPGVEVIVTNDFMDKDELINWCACNTLNCFLYDRDMPGLSATTDQAIVSGRPLSVSNNDTFRHITHYLTPYPAWSLKDAIEKSIPVVRQMQQDWTQEAFASKFEKLLSEKVVKRQFNSSMITLPLKEYTFLDAIRKRVKKYTRKIKKFFKANKKIPSAKTKEII
ncbi:hypothetical protein BH09BAC2_BH09BAC2_17070 [soil metagenome]